MAPEFTKKCPKNPVIGGAIFISAKGRGFRSTTHEDKKEKKGIMLGKRRAFRTRDIEKEY